MADGQADMADMADGQADGQADMAYMADMADGAGGHG